MDTGSENPLPENAAPELHDFYAFWRGLVRRDRLPAREDLNPQALVEQFPGLALLAVEDGATGERRYRYLFVGPGHTGAYTFPMVGRTVDDALPSQAYAAVSRTYAWVTAQRRPHYWKRSVSVMGGPISRYERLIAPLASDGTKVDALIGCWVWMEPSG